MRITDTQIEILKRLNQYRFLTTAQMVKSGASNTIKTAQQATKALREAGKPLIEYFEPEPLPNRGRFSRIYYLTKNGAKFLKENFILEPEEISYPKNVTLYSQEYFHRVATVDLHILARNFCEALKDVELDFFQTYFEKGNAVKKVPVTENISFIPDCVFQITNPDNEPFLFVGEVYRSHTTKRVFQHLCKYLRVLEKGKINDFYNYKKKIPFLILCEQENAMKSLMKRIREDEVFKLAEEYILFRTYNPKEKKAHKTAEEKRKAFSLGWQTFTGKEIGLFPVGKKRKGKKKAICTKVPKPPQEIVDVVEGVKKGIFK